MYVETGMGPEVVIESRSSFSTGVIVGPTRKARDGRKAGRGRTVNAIRCSMILRKK